MNLSIIRSSLNAAILTRRLATNVPCQSRHCVSIGSQSEDNKETHLAKEDDKIVLDKLFKTIEVEVKGNDRAVLQSYQIFATTAAKELGINVAQCWEPFRHIRRISLLRSAFAKKKYMVQYEWRTYYRVMQFKHLTGSTADTFLEYIQRNIPEGVAMKVYKTQIERLPEHIVPPKNNAPDG